ncbi:ArsR/SmtB family transcription factor [Streptomyces sp. NPDC006784]|uniref:ArsR/SmtB family transcription factor n=1 Tax=Streptomyces sp. NPDC006784 TaxID=3364764 RepID=UPI00367BAA3C
MSDAALDREFRIPPPAAGTEIPEPLPEPSRDEIRLEAVMAALSDPLRIGVVRKLLLESVDFDHTCTWFGLERPKSSLTHHFRTLREAGLVRQRQYGPSRPNGGPSRPVGGGSPAVPPLCGPGPPAA